MKIVIDIPEEQIPKKQDIIDLQLHFIDGHVVEASGFGFEERKTGHWIRELIRNEKGGCIGAKMICSECDNDNKHDEYMNYCPNCGARMEDVK